MKKLIIFGTGATADMAHDYFVNESDYYVYGFTVDSKYRDSWEHRGLRCVEWERVTEFFPPEEYDIFVAIGYKDLNHLRAEKFYEAKSKGYKCASFVSPHAYVGRGVTIGENVMIQEENNLQYGVEIGDNVMMWAANHIGHGTTIEEHVYIASHVIISGFCEIGAFTFIGVNATLNEKVKVGSNALVSATCHLSRSVDGGKVYQAQSLHIEKEFEEMSVQAQEMFAPK